jgi:Flp pilus assembly CpaF family ATPase
MSSLDRILPFLKPIEDLLVDPAITAVMVNDGGRRVFVERRGCIEQIPDRSLEVRNLTVLGGPPKPTISRHLKTDN